MKKKEWLKFKEECPFLTQGECTQFGGECCPENCFGGFVKMYPLKCGIHYTLNPKRAGKHCYVCELENRYRMLGGLQYSGTPWVAILGEKVEMK